MMNALVIFAAGFFLVFCLGFQSLTVNRGHYKSAFVMSIAIGIAHLILYKLVPQASAPGEYLAFLAGGPFGIVSSMWAHRQLFGQSVIVDDAGYGIGV